MRSLAGLDRGDAALTESKKAIDADVEALDAVDARIGGMLRTTAQWTELEAEIEKVTSSSPSSTHEAFDAYNGLTEAVRSLIVTAGNYSNLILDPDLDSFYLMDNAVNKLPLLVDTAGRADDFRIVAGGDPSEVDKQIRLAVDKGTLETTLHQQKDGFETAFKSTQDDGLQPALDGLVQSTTESTNALFPLLTDAIKGGALIDSGTAGGAASAATGTRSSCTKRRCPSSTGWCRRESAGSWPRSTRLSGLQSSRRCSASISSSGSSQR